MYYDRIIDSIVESNESFIEKLRQILFENKISIKEFSKNTDIPESTLYKIISDPKKDFRISTLRAILREIKRIQSPQVGENVIGIISTRGVLDKVRGELKTTKGTLKIKEYPATTIEEEIIQGIRAERQGVKGILCGPVAATTIEKVVSIPVISIQFGEKAFLDALINISKKI